MPKRDDEYQKQFTAKRRTHVATTSKGKFAGYFYKGEIRKGGKLRTQEEYLEMNPTHKIEEVSA